MAHDIVDAPNGAASRRGGTVVRPASVPECIHKTALCLLFPALNGIEVRLFHARKGGHGMGVGEIHGAELAQEVVNLESGCPVEGVRVADLFRPDASVEGRHLLRPGRAGGRRKETQQYSDFFHAAPQPVSSVPGFARDCCCSFGNLT